MTTIAIQLRPAVLGLLLAGPAAFADAQGVATATDAAATPQALVDGFEGAFGTHAGFRRGGAKGVCAEGHFIGTAEGRAVSSATAFSGERIPVIARFSVGGGNPKAPDKAKTMRGLALQFALPGGELWQMANISAPVNGVSTPENMLRSLEARRLDPATGKPDPAKVAAFNKANPEGRAQAEWFAKRGVPASYAAVNYWGVHAFRFSNEQGRVQHARWVFEPESGEQLLDDEQVKALPEQFLADELRRRIAPAPAAFHMRLQLAEPGDNLVNPTMQWPEGRRTVTVGRLVIDKVEPGAGGACDPVMFNPLVLPKGVEPSDDPVLHARAAAYAVSQSRRLSGK
jgi:catalase